MKPTLCNETGASSPLGAHITLTQTLRTLYLPQSQEMARGPGRHLGCGPGPGTSALVAPQAPRTLLSPHCPQAQVPPAKPKTTPALSKLPVKAAPRKGSNVFLSPRPGHVHSEEMSLSFPRCHGDPDSGARHLLGASKVYWTSAWLSFASSA